MFDGLHWCDTMKTQIITALGTSDCATVIKEPMSELQQTVDALQADLTDGTAIHEGPV